MKELLNAFNGGEISPVLAGRVDLPGLKRSCRIMRNFIPGVTGGAFRRPPLLHVGMAGADGARLIPFNASTGAAYQLELYAAGLRVWDNNGTLVATLAAPWTVAQIHAVQFVQSIDVMWLTHSAVSVRELQRTATGWTLEEIPWLWPPMRTENLTGTTITPQLVTGTLAAGQTVNLIASADTFEPGHEGGYWQVSHFRQQTTSELTVPVIPAASAVLTITGLPTAGNTLTINGTVYTWKAAADVAAPYQLAIGATAADCRDVVVAAINADATASTYGIGTAQHPDVEAVDGGDLTTDTRATGRLTADGSNDLCPSGPNAEITVGSVTYRFEDNTMNASGSTYDVRRGATLAESLANLVKAINLTGTAGVHYTTGLAAANADATAALDGGTGIILTATAAGAGGNTVATTVANTGHLVFGAATLSGGVASASYKVKVSARKLGAAGNGIVVSETMANATWNQNQLTGGADTNEASEWVRIKGQWNFETFGLWQGTVYVERQNASGGADVVRQFNGYNINRTASGTNDTAVMMRVRVAAMSGQESSDLPAPRFTLEAVESITHGVVRIDSVADTLVCTGTVLVDLYSTEPTTNWREGAFSNFRGHPACVALHEERLIFAGHASELSKVWGSVAGDFRNFEETGLSDGSWQWPFTTPQANPIRWLSSSRGLVIGTSGGERVWDSAEAGITPLNPPLQRQLTFNGSAAVQPAAVGDVVLFVQAGGQSVLEYGYENASGSYIAPDLTQLVEHLTRSGIRALAFQRFPFPVLWAVTDSGALLSCTYSRREEVVGWAMHEVGGTVESVSVCYGETGRADEVWIVVLRGIDRRIERLDPDHWQRLHGGGKVWHMDAATVGTAVSGTVSGLTHLEGMHVHLLADGAEVDPVTVVGGQVTVPGASEIIVGLANTATIQPALFDFVTDTGTSIGRKFVCKVVHVRFYQTRECQYSAAVGATFYDVSFRDAADEITSPPPLFSGVRPVQVNGRFSEGVDVVFTASGIHPLNILNLIPEFELYGR